MLLLQSDCLTRRYHRFFGPIGQVLAGISVFIQIHNLVILTKLTTVNDI